jgi:hypothetical protein
MNPGIHQSIIDGVSSPWMNSLENAIGPIASFSIQQEARLSYLADSTTNHLDAGYWRSGLDLNSHDTALCSVTHGDHDFGKRIKRYFPQSDFWKIAQVFMLADVISGL